MIHCQDFCSRVHYFLSKYSATDVMFISEKREDGVIVDSRESLFIDVPG